MSYLIRVTECEHGNSGGAWLCDVEWCPGGSRERITVDYEAAIAFMQREGIRSMAVAMDPENFIRRVVDIALGVNTE